MPAGYTPKQAQTLKERVERTVAQIEDATATLKHIVSDVDTERFTSQVSLEHCLEEYRSVAAGLHDTIDRRSK